MSLLSAADQAGTVLALGETYQVSLHGVPAFTVTAIYANGGESMMLGNGEVVTLPTTMTMLKADFDRISKDHTITTADGQFKIFGGAVPNGQGLVRIEIVKR